jgi:hypothetical protein
MSLHQRRLVYQQPIMYESLFIMADRLFENAKLSCNFYDEFLQTKHKGKDFKMFESYISTSATEKFFIQILSVLVNQREYKNIHPYIKMYLMNENYKLDYKISKEAHKKLTKDFKAFLLVIKLLQYCNTLAYMLDCKRGEMSLKDIEILLKEYCKYTSYLLRYFVINLIELLLNVRITEDNSFDFIGSFNQDVQFEIIDFLNNICSLANKTNINDYMNTAKIVFNFAKSLIKDKNERTLNTSEFGEAKKLLTNSIKRVIQLITNVNSGFFQGITKMKLEVAKMLRSNVDKNTSSELETETMKHYLDVLISMMEQLNKLKTIEHGNSRAANEVKIGSIIVKDFCEFLFKSANVLSNACVQVSKLFNIVGGRETH